MEQEANVIHECKLEISDDAVIVEFDGIRGEARGGSARAVRERLAEFALAAIMEDRRSRRREQQMLKARASYGAESMAINAEAERQYTGDAIGGLGFVGGRR